MGRDPWQKAHAGLVGPYVSCRLVAQTLAWRGISADVALLPARSSSYDTCCHLDSTRNEHRAAHNDLVPGTQGPPTREGPPVRAWWLAGGCGEQSGHLCEGPVALSGPPLIPRCQGGVGGWSHSDLCQEVMRLGKMEGRVKGQGQGEGKPATK